jgi:hypothetical protein
VLDVAGGEEVDDVAPALHGEEGEHRLAAEQVLVGDVVLVDLLVLVQVRVLAGGEVELGGAQAEHQGDRQADDADDPGVLAEVEAHPGPRAPHHKRALPGGTATGDLRRLLVTGVERQP